jgi:DNA-binding response OmpR family regulator
VSQNSPQDLPTDLAFPRLRSSPAVWRVLVAQNDPGDLEALARGLKRHGHTVYRAKTGGEALGVYRDAEVVLLDLELPDLDGLEVCREIRSASDVAVIVVTARETELDRVLGLQAGADDYVVKPYGFRELLARMAAVMRRARPHPPATTGQVLTRGPLRIDAGSREVSVAGRPVCVTRKEFDLLWLLAANPDAVVPRRQIMSQVWGDSWSRRTVDTHVSSLRGKLGHNGWIITVRGVGFRLGTVGSALHPAAARASHD